MITVMSKSMSISKNVCTVRNTATESSPRKIYSFVIETIVLLSSAYLLDDQELSPILVIGH